MYMIKFKIINLRELCRGIYNKCRSSLHALPYKFAAGYQNINHKSTSEGVLL